MLSVVIAHAGHAHAGQAAGHLYVSSLLGIAIVLYIRGRAGSHRGDQRRTDLFFGLAWVTLVLALLSPLDRLSSALASAHMVQHMLIMIVAAPLLAVKGVLPTVARGVPRPIRAVAAGGRQRAGLTRRRLEPVMRAPAVALTYGVVLWVWHIPAFYTAAVREPVVHAAEHSSFFIAAFLFWRIIFPVSTKYARAPGARILLLFAMAMQSVILALLLTFSPTPWYAVYRRTTSAWGLDPLADQQLAGVIMWVPAGMLYVVAALCVLAFWLRDIDADVVTGRA